MEKAKILMLCSHKDTPRIQRLMDKLKELGIHAELPKDSLVSEKPFAEQIVSLIANTKIIVFFISEHSINSEYLTKEIFFAYECAKTRDKKIIPIVEWENLTLKNTTLEFLLASQQILYPEDGLHSSQDYIDVVARIYEICSNSEGKELLYEKITNLSRIKYIPGISSNLSDLILLLCCEIEQDRNAQSRRSSYKELLRCMEQLQSCGESGYSTEDRKLAHKRLDAINKVDELLKTNDFHTTDLFLISFALKMIYMDYYIRADLIDTLSNGDVHGVQAETLQEKYLSRQYFYLKIYNSQIVAENITNDYHGKYAEDEIPLILQAKEFLINDDSRDIKTRKNAAKNEIGNTEKQLHAIADYMRQSNKLFEMVGSNSLASDFLKCLKTSYERLRKYSEVVGCLEICAECIERIAEINQQLEQINDTNSDNGVAESGLKALLGFSLPGTDDFDVFLSYKHEDRDIARSVYHFLKSNILNPFFDSISLPELSKSEYEDAIMNAIEHSKHFIVIISNLDYLDSYWVELEMKTFRHEMVEGRKKDANFIIVVTNDVFQKIISTNKQCLPIKYRSYEIMRVDDYKNSIINYLR